MMTKKTSRALILVHEKEVSKMKKNKKKMKDWYAKNLEKQRKTMRKWYKDNKNWYVKYRKANPEIIRESFERYRLSDKGKLAIKRYEQSPKRLASRAFYEFKRRLQINVDKGKISKYEMNKRIKKRLKEKPI